MSDSAKILYIPETMANWPWPRVINPHYEEVKAESNAWFHSLKAFSVQSQHAFDNCDFARLAALAYPWVSKEHLRTGCDLMNVFFLFDEYTDVEPAPMVREMVDIVIDALSNPSKPRPEGEVLLGEATRQFWSLGVKTASQSSQRHMIKSFSSYLESVVQQAEDRDSKRFRSIESYLEIRRDNTGTFPSYIPMELDLNLPDEVFYHPRIVELSIYIADLIVINNDIASYNREQATGDVNHNILTVAMREFKTDLKGAVDWAAKYHIEVEMKFIGGLKDVPSWGHDIDQQVRKYLYGLANFPRSVDCWSFEGGRYFGNRGLEIQKTRCVPILPKSIQDAPLRGCNVVAALIENFEVVG